MPNLPYELLSAIFQASADLTSQDHANFSLVCLDWQHPAQQELFRNISFRAHWTRKRIDVFLAALVSSRVGEMVMNLSVGIDAPISDTEIQDRDVLLSYAAVLASISAR